jgi:quercetin dioxygenase-like cupin family protein
MMTIHLQPAEVHLRSVAVTPPMAVPVIVTPQTPARETFDLLGERISVLARAEQTSGHEVFLQVGDAGSGPPPHHHPWDEAFFVTDGVVTVSVEGVDEVTGTAGCFVHVPAGTVHAFRFGEGGGSMVSITSEAGAADFFAELAQIPPGGADLPTLMGIAARRGLTILPPPDL